MKLSLRLSFRCASSIWMQVLVITTWSRLQSFKFKVDIRSSFKSIALTSARYCLVAQPKGYPMTSLGSYDAMPVGAVLPYAADTTVAANEAVLKQAGWMPCDGSLIAVDQFSDLFAVIGESHGTGVQEGKVCFRVPDLRGLYVRGVNDFSGQDPDAASRRAHYDGGATGDACGSFQGFATAAPSHPFTTDSQGAHTHTLANITTSDHYAYGGGADDKAHTNDGGTTVSASAGVHGHTIVSGGDAETRPVSLCLGWIIRYQTAAS
jgi:microcystin-dependent protein